MDEDLTTRLRALADADVPVAVDRDGVLRAGHRSRRARGAAWSALAVVVAVGLPTLAGLGPERAAVTPAAPSVTPAAPRGVVDREAGTITVPRWSDPPELRKDEAVWQTARAHVRAGCMADRGFATGWEFTGPVTPEAAPAELRPYGAWLASDVRQNGYAFVHDDRGLDLGPQEAAAWAECEDLLTVHGLARTPGGGPGAAGPYVPSQPGVLTTPEGAALRAQWAACLAESGLSASADDRESLVPAGAVDAPSDEQVRIGLVDVACKDRLDLVQRLADLDAALSARFAAEHPEAVAAWRAEVERDRPVIERAREYLERHGVTMP